jgi:NAD(P)-dependent dehydrogenase (short-subunit alcohol dehydrogenase family)
MTDAAKTKGTIVVTGGVGALGTGLVRLLVARGYRVAVVDRAAAEPRLRALEADLGPQCAGIAADVGSTDGWSAALAQVEARLGPPTGAALIAGAWTGGTPLHEEKGDEVYRAMMAANLDTARQSLHALLPGMVARNDGSIVVVGSRAALRPELGAGASAYAASKAAVLALAQAVAAEVLQHRVRVNAILPSTIDTPANRKAMPDADASRWVTVESLAGVIAFLLSDEARDISGAAIPVYGRA